MSKPYGVRARAGSLVRALKRRLQEPRAQISQAGGGQTSGAGHGDSVPASEASAHGYGS